MYGSYCLLKVFMSFLYFMHGELCEEIQKAGLKHTIIHFIYLRS